MVMGTPQPANPGTHAGRRDARGSCLIGIYRRRSMKPIIRPAPAAMAIDRYGFFLMYMTTALLTSLALLLAVSTALAAMSFASEIRLLANLPVSLAKSVTA